jgi:hypothetical protein
MYLHLVDDRMVLPKTLYMLVSSSSTRCFIFFDGESGTSAACQPDRTKPVLRDFVISLHMDMSRLITITGVEKEPMRS